jgi:hypothetical protein
LFYNAGGGCLAIDMGKTLRADSQIVLPHANTWPYAAPSYRITSGGMAGGVLGVSDIATNTGILDLRYHGDASHPEYGNGPKLVAIGDGNLTIDNVTLTSSAASDCATYVLTTGTALYIHHTTFWGQQGQTAGCSTAIVMGGSQNGMLQSTGQISDHFGGYGSVIRENRFIMMGRVAWLRSGANGVFIDGNYVVGGNATTHPHAIDIVGFGLTADADRANVISNNLIEMGAYGSSNLYSCGVNLQNAMQNIIYGNQFWDGDLSTYALCGDSTTTQNNFDRTNFVDGGGTQIASPTWSSNNYMPYRTIGFFFDGGGSPLAGTTTRCSLAGFGGTIAQFAMAADQPGNATVTVKAVNISSYTGPASAVDISNGGESLAGAAAKVDTTLTGWTYLARNSPAGSIVQPNTMICFTLSNPSTITWLTGQISIWEGR